MWWCVPAHHPFCESPIILAITTTSSWWLTAPATLSPEPSLCKIAASIMTISLPLADSEINVGRVLLTERSFTRWCLCHSIMAWRFQSTTSTMAWSFQSTTGYTSELSKRWGYCLLINSKIHTMSCHLLCIHRCLHRRHILLCQTSKQILTSGYNQIICHSEGHAIL